MNDTNDGGPAFPVPVIEFNGRHYPMTGCPDYRKDGMGMSRRDYFAAKAMQGLLACPELNGDSKDFSKWAVKHADALLAELDKKDESK